MDIKEIKKIIELMKVNELTEFELQEEEFRLVLKRKNGSDQPIVVSAATQAPVMMSHAAPAAAATDTSAGATAAGAAAPADDDAGLAKIVCPMVGTFYRSASPEAESFVNVGDTVDEDTVVCIVEAMKVMNEIKAEVRGVVKKIPVENATSVEYGQTLILIEPK